MRVVALILAITVCLGADAAALNNPYGAHTFIQDIMSDDMINKHLDWAASLTGPGGYVKQLMYPINPANTTINPQWPKFINGCYSRGLIPVIRLATWAEGGSWVKPTADSPGNYTTWANGIKTIVSQMPRNDNIPLYIEVLNECNNNAEWSGSANPTEYAQFFVQTSNAIRSLGDSRIKVMNCGLSPGGSYDNVSYVDACCNVPGFVDAFDVWACHPYPFYPPETNIHDGTASMGQYTIDSYMAELQVLANHGRSNVKVIATETAYGLRTEGEDYRADQIMRAFRDYWSKWPEVLGICPYEFCDPFGGNNDVDWVDHTSGTTVDKLPTVAHQQYWSVYNLAKAGNTTGCISGKVTESVFGAPLAGAQVVLSPGAVSATTDGAGNFFFPRLAPGTYSLAVSRTNYSSGSASGIGLSAAENEVRNFSLSPTTGCNIAGTVTDSLGGQGIQGVQITLSPGGLATTTAADGSYQFIGITPSAYTLTASKYSYYSFKSQEMTLLAGDTKTLNFRMGPGALPAGTSLIPESGFDYPLGTGVGSGWSAEGGGGSHFTVDSTTCYSGIASQKIDPFGTSNDMVWTITNYSAVFSGSRYRVEAWCKTGSGISGTAKLIANWFTNDMTPMGSFTASPQVTTPDGWTLLVGRGICPSMPSSQNRGRLQVELRAQTTAGSVWFDEAWCGPDNQAEDPLPSITNLTWSVSSGATQLSWKNSTGAACTGTKVVYRTDRYPLNATDGTLLADVSGSPGASLICTHSGQIYAQRYYYAFFAHSSGGANLSRPRFATAVGSDSTQPPTPVVTDDGDYTFSLDTLSASWSCVDPESGVADFRYCIGTSPSGRDVSDWTSVGSATQVTRSGLSLQPGARYYFTVLALNGAGYYSALGHSDGIYAVRDCASIAEAKSLADGAMVRITGAVVTAGGAFTGCVYVEDSDRSSGIRVAGNLPAMVEGSAVTLIGSLGTANGERTLTVQ